MRSLRLLLALLALTGCGARTILADPNPQDASIQTDALLPLDTVFFEDFVPSPDVVIPRSDVVFPDTVFFEDFVPSPNVVIPPPDVVIPPPDVVIPPPDVVIPPPDVVIPPPDVVTSGNGRCAMATELAPGALLRGRLEGGVDVPMGCAGDPAPQPAVWYRTRVPAGRSVTVTLSGSPRLMRTLVMRLSDGCGSACVASTFSSFDGVNLIARWTNNLGREVELVTSVAPANLSPTPQEFTITAALSAPHGNRTCSAALPVMDGSVLPNQELALATELQPPCPGMLGSGNASLYYRAFVSPGETLFASATPSVTGRPAPVIRVIPACGTAVCLAASTASGTTSAASFHNATTTAQFVFIAVGAQDLRTAVPVTLSVSIRPPAPNGVCAAPLRVMNGTVLRAESLADGRETPTACPQPGRDARALFYAVRVGAGEQLSVLAARVDGTFTTPTVRLFDRCGATACLAQSTNTGTSGRLSYVNTTGEAQELLFAVNLQDGGASSAARVAVSVSVARPPYTVSTIPADCDVVTGTTLPGAVGDDAGNASEPLPIAFTFFGAPVAQWSASTNGYLQLWPTSGRSGGALGQAELPSANAPTGMLAVFWDDLDVRAGADVRWQVFDTPSRHLTVQWTNVGFCCGGTNPDRLTFQARLFERSGVIEYHYCALNGSMRTTGSGASIGMQDPNALRGVSYAVRRAGAVMTGTAIRFTP